MATLKTRAIAVLLTFAMIFSVSSPVVAYADGDTDTDSETNSEPTAELGTKENPLILDWVVKSHTEPYSFNASLFHTYYLVTAVTYPAEASENDKIALDAFLYDILHWSSWDKDNTGNNVGPMVKASTDNTGDLYPTDFTVTVNGEEKKITSSAEFLNYVNGTLLARSVNGNYYQFSSAPSSASASTSSSDDGSGTTIGGGVQFDKDGNRIPNSGESGTGGEDGTDDKSNSNDDSDLIDDPDAISGDANANTNPEPTSGDANANSALSADSDLGSTLVTAFGLLTVVGEFALIFAWDKLPVAHKATGTLTDASGAAIAGATITFAKDGTVIQTVTTDASGSFEVDVPQGDSALTATPDEDPAAA